ncbi:ATP-binding protein [Streptomyces sp. NPDC020965]|uniref:ATP-binding protein n=1 Tax=Streptomyces sp. NPDC020965 TaxID=3365105 RepID=UPI0037BE04B8
MTYRYLILGPTRAVRPDGTGVGLGGARLRALLTALAAGAGRAVRPAELGALIWGADDDRPADEAAALQALVGRLRRAIGPASVELTPGGYRLAADRDAVDLFRFERLTTEGITALDAGHAAEAAALLDEALTLWRGPALADLPEAGSDPVAVRAEQRRDQARAAGFRAALDLGRAPDVLAELTAYAAESPFDESRQALRLRALAAAGRPAEALQAYEQIRARLADRLGTDPGAELRALHARLLTPAATVAAGRGNLRARLTSFVGRESELADLGVAVRTHRLVTLVGPGGAGKTRLALEAADAVIGAWPDGVRVAELAPVRDEGTLPEAVLTALGARESPPRLPGAAEPRGPLDQLVEHCAESRLLLVLDNCEHLIDAAARLADALLGHCPGVHILATSREPLGVPGESVRSVRPLPPETALRLLADRGAAARPGFRTDDDPDACAEICRRLDGLPLAIELAAARLRMLTPRQIADRLDDRFRLLTGGSRTVLPRQQTLRAVVDWSWDLLDAPERAVLRRLSVFSGGCALPQAEEVCGANSLSGRDAPDVLATLAALVDKSLVVAVPDAGDGMRYRLLETVAEYASERLDEAGERDAVVRRHLCVYRELARTGEPELRGPGQAGWLDRFETEHENLRTALRAAVRLADEQEALCLTLAMSWFWQQRGHQADARTWSTAAAALTPDPFAAPVRPAGPLAERCTDTPLPWTGETLWEARRSTHLMVLACSGIEDSVAGATAGPRLQEYLGRIVAAYRPGLPQLRRQPGSMWFFARLMKGGFGGLLDTVDAIVAANEDPPPGTGWDLAFALIMRSRLRSEGRDGQGGDADRALALFAEAGDPWGVAEALSARGEEHERQGRYAAAAADYERAARDSERVGAHSQATVFTARLAAVRLRTAADADELARAERALLDVVEEARGRASEVIGTGRMLLARHYGATGRTTLARGQLRRMDGETHTGAPGLFHGLLAGTHGWLDCLDEEYERARERVREAVGHLGSLAYVVAPQLVADQFLCAAWAMAGLGAAGDGARILAVYDDGDRGQGSLGFQPFDDGPTVRRRTEAALRAVLGDAEYTRAYEAGRGLSVREAAALI